MLAILGNHSHIHAVPTETSAFYHSYEWRHRRFQAWNRTTVRNGKSRWAEKTPKHIRRIPAILKLYPRAQIVLMVRDGRDVACSMMARFGDMQKGIRLWVSDNRAGLPFWTHSRVHVLKYEDLVRKTERSLRALFAFLQEPYESDVTRIEDTAKQWYSRQLSKPPSEYGDNHRHYRNWQINQPLFDGSGRWLREMDETARNLFKRIAGPMLITLGYVQDNNWCEG